MINKINQKHTCDEGLVSDFIDNRMDDKEKQAYINKIEDCTYIRKCNHCKKLISEFVSLKKNLFLLKKGFTMPKSTEINLLSRIRSSFKDTNYK